MTPILGMPMIGHVALRCKLKPIFERVIVATCDTEIVDYCRSIGVEAVMTSSSHERASDRVQEAIEIVEKREGIRFDVVTMVQGDEPMVTPKMLETALEAMNDASVDIVNLRSLITDPEEWESPNCVKVVVNLKDEALYFSREPIPSRTKYSGMPKAFKQVCIIPFRREFLDLYSKLKPTLLEEVESVDMNRVLEHGFKVKCVEILEPSYPVDVVADVQRVSVHLSTCPLVQNYLA